MYGKIILNLLAILFLSTIELSFIGTLPFYLNNFNLTLVAVIFILSLFNLKLALWWSLAIGLMFDLFSFAPFGLYLISLGLTVVISYFLLTNFFTDRSLYSFLALVTSATILYSFFIYLISYLVFLAQNQQPYILLDNSFWSAKISQWIANSLFTVLLFYLLLFISKKLKPVFLTRGKYQGFS